MKKLFFTFAFIVLSVVVCLGQSSNKQADLFVKGTNLPITNLTTTDGHKITSDELKGKVVVYNFGFENCPPCHIKMKGLNSLYNKYKNNNDVVILYISLDNEETTKVYKAKYNAGYQFVSINKIKPENLRKSAISCPAIVIVDKTGKIVYKKSGGAMDEKTVEENLLENISRIVDDELNKSNS
jgi:cytochrome oxidase Cu insertion factor (SCO1/SenC/PrrC family)